MFGNNSKDTYFDNVKTEIFSQYIEIIEKIESLWMNDTAYQNVYSKILKLKSEAPVLSDKSNDILVKINRTIALLEGIKEVIIADNSIQIYDQTLLVNTLQKRNLDFAIFIGNPENIQQIFGENGEKLKISDFKALEYLDSLIERGNAIREELNNIRARAIRNR